MCFTCVKPKNSRIEGPGIQIKKEPRKNMFKHEMWKKMSEKGPRTGFEIRKGVKRLTWLGSRTCVPCSAVPGGFAKNFLEGFANKSPESFANNVANSFAEGVAKPPHFQNEPVQI